MYSHRLIGQFDGDYSFILLDVFIGSKCFPDSLQLAVILVANTDITRTDTRWTYDDVESVGDGVLN